MAFGELRPSPASEAGGEPQEDLLPIIRTRSVSSSPGEGRLRNLGRRLAEQSVGACAVEAAQAGKALSSPAEGGGSRMALGKLSPELRDALASEAPGEPQEELLSIITASATSSHGEGRFGDLWRRLAELRAATYAVEADLNTMKLKHEHVEVDKELLEQNPSQAAIAVSNIRYIQETVLRLQDDMMNMLTSQEKLGEMPTLYDELMQFQDNHRPEIIHGLDELDIMTRTFKQISLNSTDSNVSSADGEAAKGGNHRESEGSLKDLASRVENISSEFHVIKGECRRFLLCHDKIHSAANLLDRNNLIKYDRKTGHLNNTRASICRCDEELSSTSTVDSDSEDDVLNLLTETRQPHYQHMPSEDFILPELSSLDLSLQLASNKEMSGIASPSSSSSSSSSNSSSNSDDLTSLDDPDGIYSERDSIGIAADEEEEILLAEASLCVSDDMEAIELIMKHDEQEVYANLGMLHPVRTQGAERETLLDLRIVFFAKEKSQSSYSVCINDFDTTDRCIRLQCRHLFHFKCIIKWLLTNNTCPVCRAPLSDEHVNRAGGGLP